MASLHTCNTESQGLQSEESKLSGLSLKKLPKFVTEIQEGLISTGFLQKNQSKGINSADGIFGPNSKKAALNFQNWQKITNSNCRELTLKTLTDLAKIGQESVADRIGSNKKEISTEAINYLGLSLSPGEIIKIKSLLQKSVNKELVLNRDFNSETLEALRQHGSKLQANGNLPEEIEAGALVKITLKSLQDLINLREGGLGGITIHTLGVEAAVSTQEEGLFRLGFDVSNLKRHNKNNRILTREQGTTLIKPLLVNDYYQINSSSGYLYEMEKDLDASQEFAYSTSLEGAKIAAIAALNSLAIEFREFSIKNNMPRARIFLNAFADAKGHSSTSLHIDGLAWDIQVTPPLLQFLASKKEFTYESINRENGSKAYLAKMTDERTNISYTWESSIDPIHLDNAKKLNSIFSENKNLSNFENGVTLDYVSNEGSKTGHLHAEIGPVLNLPRIANTSIIWP